MFEDKYIYWPIRHPEGDWDTARLSVPVRDLFFNAPDGVKLHAWYSGGSSDATLLYFHGNAGNVTHRADFFARLTRLPVNVLLLDYRGYGKSEGRPTEDGLYLDARAAYDHLVGPLMVPPRCLFLIGKSLGGAVAIELAGRVKCAGLIVQSTFTDGHAMARLKIPYMPLWFTRNQFDSLSKVPVLTLPKLFLHGRGDEMIPISMGRRLFEAAAEPKDFFDLGDVDHNDLGRLGLDYDERLRAFLTP